MTDEKGAFTIYLSPGARLEISSLGYSKVSVNPSNNPDTLRISLLPSSIELNEVIIKPKKEKYSKRNNPAVDLIRSVRNAHSKHDPVGSVPFYSYDRYDKTILALNNYNGYLPSENGEIKGKFKSLVELVDTAIWTGKRILDLSMKEKFVSRITTDKGVDKDIVLSQRSNGIDKQFDNQYTNVLFDDILREVNVYDNDIQIMRNRFVSPLSNLGPDFYKYHLGDTVYIGTDRCVEVTFVPRNAESMGFNGSLFIPVNDSVKYVRRVMMRLPKASNVNYVENLFLSQNFRKDSLGFTHKTLDDIIIELHIAGSVGQFYVSRQSRYDNQSYNKRTDLVEYYDKVGETIVVEGADAHNFEYWQGIRMLPLTSAESHLAFDESPFKKYPVIYWTTKVVELIVKGFIATGKKSKFDIGPIDTFISYDGLEGLRLAIGGVTTANLRKNLFARGYVAYGFKDHKWKYNAEIEYSFNKKKYHNYEFPLNGIRATYRYDVFNLGQHFLSNNAGNLLNSIVRMDNRFSIYERAAKLEYNIEWMNHLSFHASLNHRRFEDSRLVQFIDGNNKIFRGYDQNSIRLQLRWAPDERFMQTYIDRQPLSRDGMVLTFAYEFGPKKLFGSEYTLNLTEFCFEKRLWFSAFGHLDILFKAAKLWNQVQFPALLWQNANIAYTIRPETFSLLNPMEFAMDQYVSLDIDYNLNGLIFNRIPFIKKLGLREVVSFKGFAGNLTKKNNPYYNDNLFRFPDESSINPMGKTPYMELGVGIDNILTFLRLDYIWRLSYRNTPGAPNSGLRFCFFFTF